jgi:arylsulfatase A-like enzyme
MIAAEEDMRGFEGMERNSRNHHGELVAMDRSIGALRAGLRRLGIADNTLLWFCSDNGGLPEIRPGTVGELRGFKGSLYEGGLRVPGIVEWPAVITKPRVTSYPAGTFDIFPTIAEITGLPATALLAPVDGLSIRPLFTADIQERPKPMGFRHTRRAALIGNRYKVFAPNINQPKFEVYDLQMDPREEKDLSSSQPELAARLSKELLAWNESVQASVAGRDYAEGRLLPGDQTTRPWASSPDYQPHLAELQKRPEYRDAVTKAGRKKGG